MIPPPFGTFPKKRLFLHRRSPLISMHGGSKIINLSAPKVILAKPCSEISHTSVGIITSIAMQCIWFHFTGISRIKQTFPMEASITSGKDEDQLNQYNLSSILFSGQLAPHHCWRVGGKLGVPATINYFHRCYSSLMSPWSVRMTQEVLRTQP